MIPTDHTASRIFDVVDPASEDRWSIYRCDTCFALVASEDAADHGRWHADQAARKPVYGWAGESS